MTRAQPNNQNPTLAAREYGEEVVPYDTRDNEVTWHTGTNTQHPEWLKRSSKGGS